MRQTVRAKMHCLIDQAGRILSVIHDRIVACERCSRLRSYCEHIGREKRKAYQDDTYWARPVPGFGDPHARLLIVGLAPAAHGANRTGRVFTGDGVGGSGDFLMSALHRAGFANRGRSERSNDGLSLRDAYITMAVRCAPPDNKPTPQEIRNCLVHLDAEMEALERVRVVLALGKVGFDSYLLWLKGRGHLTGPRPQFGHGLVYQLTNSQTLIGCYHPSRQNTQTGKLTRRMMYSVLLKAREQLEQAGRRRLADQ